MEKITNTQKICFIIAYHQKEGIKRLPFPEHLKHRYRNFTEPDLTKLWAATSHLVRNSKVCTGGRIIYTRD